MPIQILPKNTQKGVEAYHRTENIIVAIALIALLSVAGAYSLLRFVFENEQEKKNADWRQEFAEAGGAEQRQMEETLVQYQGKINAVQALLAGQKTPIPMFEFLEKYTLRGVAFSSANISVAEGK
ncbi:MAG: hypothetical protein HYV77_03840, partial [Candidatus Wildermuthbacteria bacterium]|nr:hypothetical protein [Candidatus Wildermuthbacteria bacterium]